MRKVAWLAAIGLFSTQAAWAEELAPAQGPAIAASPLLTATVALAPTFERFDLLAQIPRAAAPFERLKGAIRHRFGSAMVDLYPIADSGFHFAVGTRFFRKANIRRDQQEATNGLLYVPRLPRGGFGQRGFRRATAAATMGYSQAVASNMVVGIEGGTLLGRLVQPLPSAARLAGLPGFHREESGTRVNPVLNLTLGYAF